MVAVRQGILALRRRMLLSCNSSETDG